MNFKNLILFLFLAFYSLFAHPSTVPTACSTVFQRLTSKILDEKGQPRPEFQGMEGYALFAEQNGYRSMQTVFNNVSTTLKKTLFKKLGWQYFAGNVKQYRAYREKILNEKGELRLEFIGIEGYVRFADLYEEGKMHKAFGNVSAVLNKTLFKKLGWQQFYGSTTKFRTYREKILNETGKLRPEFIGIEGYARFADLYEEGKMHKAFKNVSVILDKIDFKNLGWKSFYGSVLEFRSYKSKILDEEGRLRPEFIGMEGYVRFADLYEEGKMHKAFGSVSAVLDKALFKKLGWSIFRGDVREFRRQKSKILHEDGSFRMEFVGMEGYARFAEKYADGNMHKSFFNVSSVLNREQFKNLGWQQFHGNVEKFKSYRNKILDQEGKLRPEFIGIDGYAHFAEKYEDGAMRTAFSNVSAILSKKQFQGLRWKAFHGSIATFRAYREKILDPKSEELRPEFTGMAGYAHFTEKYEDGKMSRAFNNVSAILDKDILKKLGWQQFQGSTTKFRTYREKILNEKGELRPEFIGIEGYVRFAEKYEDGYMLRTFINVSASLDSSQFQELAWKSLTGTSSQFLALIEDFVNHYPEGYQGQEGQKRIANKIFKGNQKVTYKNMSTLRDYFFGERKKKNGLLLKNDEFQNLKWILPQ